MGSIKIFDGTGSISDWEYQVRTKLMAKGYRSQLTDANKPENNGPELNEWNKQADKAIGIIGQYLHKDVAIQFITKVTPQTLLEAIVAHYNPDVNQEIERLERGLNKLTYDGTDPVAWGAKTRALIAKLTAKNAAPNDRTIRNLILNALEEGSEYKVRVEVIRHTTPNISLADLWAEIGRLSYPPTKERRLCICFYEFKY